MYQAWSRQLESAFLNTFESAAWLCHSSKLWESDRPYLFTIIVQCDYPEQRSHQSRTLVMFGIASPVRINPVRVVSIANANRDMIEPDVAALSLMLSPFHLSIPRSFLQPFTTLCRNKHGRNESPYGLSGHCLLSTDSLIPLLPIGEGHHIHQAIGPAIYETDSASMNSSTQPEADGSESPPLKIPTAAEFIPKKEPSESSASPGSFPQVTAYLYKSFEHRLISKSTNKVGQDGPRQRYVCPSSQSSRWKLTVVQSSTTLHFPTVLSLHPLRPSFLIWAPGPRMIVLAIMLHFFLVPFQVEHVPQEIHARLPPKAHAFILRKVHDSQHAEPRGPSSLAMITQPNP